MNPYVVPGFEADPLAPLCPYADKEHDAFYVPVDDTEREYQRFQRLMGAVSALTSRGRLVVVTGKAGCGKTSLINRCAAWLREELAAVGLRGEIFPLQDSAQPTHTIMLRMEQVVGDLVDGLRDEQFEVGQAHLTELGRRVEDIEETERLDNTGERQAKHVVKVSRVYKYLNDALPADRVAIILLPPSSDLVDEIRDYAGFARHPRVVFFAETDYVEQVSRSWETIRTNGAMAPLRLQVGPLNAGDGWTYAASRQGTGTGSFPKVSEETMRRVTDGRPVSIGELQKLLHGVYEELSEPDAAEIPLPSGEVSYDHIAGHYFRQMFAKPGSAS